MSHQRYSLPAIVLHWLQAAIVIWLLWLGWTMVDLPKGAERSAAYGLHKSLGLLTMLLVAIRLVWRRTHAAPPPLGQGWENKLASAAHHGLYLFLIIAPLAGYLASSFTPYAIKFFGLELPKTGWPDESLNGFFKLLHQTLVWSGAALIALHVAGALKHTLKRDGTLQRMLPGWLLRN
ncbi:MAG: cytochrome B [Betaproteobacteria bacterium HGW-Betaproteobacteria-10]|jgi:cytochrome b561|nr:MAG: cytochrome B [Betaproteobacteria bacterium HGW-Betaproteobacteria-10]